jgi:hypothetical protein
MFPGDIIVDIREDRQLQRFKSLQSSAKGKALFQSPSYATSRDEHSVVSQISAKFGGMHACL